VPFRVVDSGGFSGVRRSLVLSQKSLEKAAAGAGLAGSDGRILLLNDSGATLLGYTPQECVGMNLAGLFDADRAMVQSIEKALRAEATSVRTEGRFRRKDGSFFSGRLSVSMRRVAPPSLTST
jgi:PAS domain S-box-containing protein